MSIDFQQEKRQKSADVVRKLATPRTSMISNPVTGDDERIFVSVIHVGTITLFPPFRVKTIDTGSCPPRYRHASCATSLVNYICVLISAQL